MFLIAGFINLFGVLLGLLCIKKGEKDFIKYHITDVFQAHTERVYWAVCFNTLLNMLILSLSPIQYLSKEVHDSFWIFGAVVGIMCVIWNWILLEHISSGLLNDRKNK